MVCSARTTPHCICVGEQPEQPPHRVSRTLRFMKVHWSTGFKIYMTKRCKHSISPKKLAAIRFEITVTPPDVQLQPQNMLDIQIDPALIWIHWEKLMWWTASDISITYCIYPPYVPGSPSYRPRFPVMRVVRNACESSKLWSPDAKCVMVTP